MDTLLGDIRHAFRGLVNRPSFVLVVVITLGLAIGANTAIFSVIDAVLLRPLPYQDANRLVKIFESNQQKEQPRLMVSLSDFHDWRIQSQSFENMAALAHVSFRVTGASATEEVLGNRVSSNFFQLLGVKPKIGRAFLADDEKAGSDHVALLSHAYWVSHFGSDPNVTTRTITLNDKPHLVVGVLPEDFRQTFQSLPGRARIWTPAVIDDDDGTHHGPGGYSVIARLKPDITIQQARKEMSAVSQRLAEAFPKTNTGVTADVYWLHEEVTQHTRQSLLVLFMAVGSVFLIACANIASLLLARGLERAKEVAIRLAIGAPRSRVVRQLLTESLLLCGLGGAVGWLLATWILRAIAPFIPPDLPRANEVALDHRSLMFTFSVSLLAGLIFGLSPAVHTASLNLTAALKDSGHTSSEKRQSRRPRQALIVFQVALTTVLLIGAGLLTNSLIRLYRADPGFDTKDLLTMSVRLQRFRGEVPAQWHTFWDSLVETSSRIPGIRAAALVSPLPLGGSRYLTKVRVAGSDTMTSGEESTIGYHTVSQNYFEVVGVRLLQGRGFTVDDKPGSPPAVVVNERFAQTYFPGQQIIGRGLIVDSGSSEETLATIVGVVSDSRVKLDEKVQPQFYQLMSQFPQPSMNLVARTSTDPTSLFGAMRTNLASLRPNQPVGQLTTMEHLWAEYTVRPRFYLTLLGGLSLLGMALSTVGIYGLLSHNVSRLTHQIGIRRALGARDRHLLKFVILQGMILALIGVVGGVLGASLVTRLIGEWLYEVRATDPVTFAVVAFVLMLVAFLACYIPARRATKIDPLVALRYE